ncbi:MAG: polysaccharide biosynthesis protein [Nitrosotalea sp.]
METNFFNNKKILITGGTGSIGKSLVELLKGFNPKEIRIFSNDEYELFKMREEKDPIRLVAGDITNYDVVKRAVRDCDIVFHGAALKHITICELNPSMAINTNVLGTQNIINACLGNAKIFVNISTDKAVNPVSTLGATKLLGEKLTSAANYVHSETKCWSVRFGNVIGSRGSVYEAFLVQLKNGKNLQVTDKRMTRFIMSVNQAANLILKTCSIAQGGEVFVLKMPSIRILDLAETMNEIYSAKHQTPKKEIEIMGIREAERLYEELVTESETEFAYETDDMFIIQSPFERYETNSLQKTTHKNYRSDGFIPLSKDEIRKVLLEDFLLVA